MQITSDFTSLLEPIPGDRPGGVDLRDDDDPNNIFRRVKDLRSDARQEETQSDLVGGVPADAIRVWREVWEEGSEYLKNQAKDLEIAAYMIEASIRLDGFAGLAVSLNLTAELVSRFWGELLPTPDEDGIETTILPISRLNGDVITYALMRVPVTPDTSIDPLVVWEYQQAQQLEQMAQGERELRVARGAHTLTQFNQAVAETPPEFFASLYQDLLSARQAIENLDAVFEEKAGEEFAPNFSKFLGSLSDAEAVLRQVAGDMLVRAVDEPQEEVADSDAVSEQGGSAPAAPVEKREGINSRQDAFSQLEKIAQWIEKHEPQSLVPSEIRKVIRRGNMTPVELFEDLISDADVRKRLYRDVGIEVGN